MRKTLDGSKAYAPVQASSEPEPRITGNVTVLDSYEEVMAIPMGAGDSEDQRESRGWFADF